MREDLKLRAEENGASIIGDIDITEMDRKGRLKRINCRDDVGDSGYGIPKQRGEGEGPTAQPRTPSSS
jgi:DNA topoisomerase-6 subunit A